MMKFNSEYFKERLIARDKIIMDLINKLPDIHIAKKRKYEEVIKK